ncbi:PAS domain-containing sensor histidine kinase [Salinigranum rubrum]|uniref:histidine kinase n=1 Tax=Salinigranum rubrum TaxID=755307 RepID=A0A2I8VGW2_9EURY|nr:ATP-binding protein [Salinigranum rubrum]AUV81150.1 PAS domain-containing sensor histidine kinase [Salinigranum rubrum]
MVHLHDDDAFEGFGTTLADREGFEVLSTTDTDAAVDRLGTEPVDCVVVACSAPGEWALRALRDVRGTDPDVPCLLLTAAPTVPVEVVDFDLTTVVRVDADAGPDGSTALARRVAEALDESHRTTGHERERQRLRQYESIVEGMTDVVYTVDESLVVTYTNDRALAYAEVPREAVVGRSIRALSEQMLVEEPQVDRFVAALERVITGETDSERLELELDLPCGLVVAGLRVTPLWTDGDDGPAGAVVISRDITDRVTRERTLKRQNERLDTFSSVVSHDLRAPLSVAHGNLDLARLDCAEGDFDAVEERLDAVERAHDRMDTLIDDLLTVARQGTRAENRSVVDIDALATESWTFVGSDAATLDADTGLAVHADESRLRQFFENLFRNSVEHGSTNSRPQAGDSVEHGSTGDGGDTAGDSSAAPDASVHVRVGALDGGDGFFVEDDGPGIPPDARETVFEGGYSTKSGGTGFGLMIVREIADTHGWDVTVTDGSRGGARFEVRGVQVESA